VALAKTFENEWIFEPLAHRPGFRKKRMFGGLAAYLHDRLLMVLVEPTKSGRWKWHGVLVATSKERHDAIRKEFPSMAPHDVLSKWLYVDSRDDEFEPVMQAVAEAMARHDARFGVVLPAVCPLRVDALAPPLGRGIDPRVGDRVQRPLREGRERSHLLDLVPEELHA
jgi:hypothetical protein